MLGEIVVCNCYIITVIVIGISTLFLTFSLFKKTHCNLNKKKFFCEKILYVLVYS